MTEGLKPCPFCPDGGVVVELKKDGEPTGIVAHACYALGIEIRAPKPVWNTRYKQTCKWYYEDYHDETNNIWTTECGERFSWAEYGHPKRCPSCGAEVVDD